MDGPPDSNKRRRHNDGSWTNHFRSPAARGHDEQHQAHHHPSPAVHGHDEQHQAHHHPSPAVHGHDGPHQAHYSQPSPAAARGGHAGSSHEQYQQYQREASFPSTPVRGHHAEYPQQPSPAPSAASSHGAGYASPPPVGQRNQESQAQHGAHNDSATDQPMDYENIHPHLDFSNHISNLKTSMGELETTQEDQLDTNFKISQHITTIHQSMANTNAKQRAYSNEKTNLQHRISEVNYQLTKCKNDIEGLRKAEKEANAGLVTIEDQDKVADKLCRLKEIRDSFEKAGQGETAYSNLNLIDMVNIIQYKHLFSSQGDEFVLSKASHLSQHLSRATLQNIHRDFRAYGYYRNDAVVAALDGATLTTRGAEKKDYAAFLAKSMGLEEDISFDKNDDDEASEEAG